jgi:hypothetical protein
MRLTIGRFIAAALAVALMAEGAYAQATSGAGSGGGGRKGLFGKLLSAAL